MMATVSALRSPAHRWPRLARPIDSEGAADRVLTAAMAMKAAQPICPSLNPPGEDFGQAVALYERRRWDTAFDMLCRLADRGDTPAAKLALLMLRYGEALYGTRFGARPEQIARWARMVLEAAPASAALVAGSLEQAA